MDDRKSSDPPSSIANALEEEAIKERTMDVQLISADSHVNPRPTMWREYLPAAFHERAPRLESTDEGDFEVFEGQRKPILALSSLAGKKPEEYSLTVRRLTDTRAGGWDPAARLQD